MLRAGKQGTSEGRVQSGMFREADRHGVACSKGCPSFALVRFPKGLLPERPFSIGFHSQLFGIPPFTTYFHFGQNKESGMLSKFLLH